MPDQDEIARSAPKSAPPQISRLSGSEQLQSSVDSEGTLRSSSVSHPPDHTLQSRGVAEKEAETGEMEGEPSSTSLQAPDEVFEEIAETHVVLRSRYISDDQVAGHCNLYRVRLALSLCCMDRAVPMAT